MSFPDEVTETERKAVKNILFAIKRFWMASSGLPDEDAEAERLIDSVITLAKESEK